MSRLRFRPVRLALLVGVSSLAVSMLAGAGYWALTGSPFNRDGGDATSVGADGDAPAYLATVDQARTAVGRPADSPPAAPNPGTAQPYTLGDEPALDDLWRRCGDGSGAACDQLFDQAPVDSDYEAFGLSCGNRHDILRCTTEMDEPPTTQPPPTVPVSD